MVENTIVSLAIYIKIRPRKVRSQVIVQSGKLGPKPIHTVLEREPIKG